MEKSIVWKEYDAKYGRVKVCTGLFVAFDDLGNRTNSTGGSVYASRWAGVRTWDTINRASTQANRDVRLAPDRISIDRNDIKLYHDTELSNVFKIMEIDDGFRGGADVTTEIRGKNFITLSWWSICYNWQMDFELDTRRFETSPLWRSETKSPFGNYRFTFRINDLLASYIDMCIYHGLGTEMEFRKLGTYVYTRKVMYSVVVCPKNSNIFPDETFPLIGVCHDKNTMEHEHEIVMLIDDELSKCQQLLYHPSSFVQYDRQNIDRLSWDQVAFAFYLPEGTVLQLPRNAHHPTTFPRFSVIDSVTQWNSRSKEDATK